MLLFRSAHSLADPWRPIASGRLTPQFFVSGSNSPPRSFHPSFPQPPVGFDVEKGMQAKKPEIFHFR